MALAGFNPSGIVGTTFFNGGYQSLIWRYAFFVLRKRHEESWGVTLPRRPVGREFSTVCVLATFGDDHENRVEEEAQPFMTMPAVAGVFAEIGMEYTEADKTPLGTRSYLKRDEVTFLKRSHRFSEELGMYIAPIEFKSTLKSLHWVSRDSGLSKSEHCSVAIHNCLCEVFLHGRAEYEEAQVFLLQVARLAVVSTTRESSWTYDERVLRWREKYLGGGAEASLDLEVVRSVNCPINIGPGEFNCVRPVFGTPRGSPFFSGPGGDRKTGVQFGGIEFAYVTVNYEFSKNTKTFLMTNDGGMDDVYGCPSNLDNTYAVGASASVLPNDVLYRPVLGGNYVWANGVVPYISIDPLALWWADPQVNARVSRAALCQVDLEVIFRITGTPTHRGVMMCAVEPLSSYNNVDNVVGDCVANVAAVRITRSQRQHVLLTANANTVATLRVPFVSLDNWWVASTAGTTGRSTIDMIGLTNLENSNGAADSVGVQYMIRATRVVLEGATFQSEGGASSHISSAMTSLAGMAEGTGHAYGTAAGAALRLGSNLAKMLGFSRPTDLRDYAPMVMRDCAPMCVMDAKDTGQVIAADSKCALSTSCAAVGLCDDEELTISSIVQRPSFLDSFPWVTTMPIGTVIAAMRVSPTVMYPTIPVDLNRRAITAGMVIHTPMSHLSQMFEYWTGSVIMRFVVVGTKFHTGSLRFIYDPNYTPAGTGYNVAKSALLDLATGNEVELRIPWTQQQAYRKVFDFSSAQTPGYIGGARYGVSDVVYSNGTVTVEVATPLVGPNPAVESIDILWYIAGGPDMEFAGPSKSYNDATVMFQSEQGALSKSDGIKPCGDLCADAEVMGIEGGSREKQNLIYFGERLVSMRALLKKFVFHRGDAMTCPVAGDASLLGSSFVSMNRPIFPINIGFDQAATGALDVCTNATYPKYNFVRNTPLNYLRPCYLMWRGAIRYKFACFQTTAGVREAMYLERIFPGKGSVYVRSNAAISDFANNSSVSLTASQSLGTCGVKFSGGTIAHGPSETVMEVTIPDYNYRRAHAAQELSTWGSAVDDTKGNQYLFGIRAPVNNANVSRVNVQTYVAAGDDFSFLGYLNAPPVYYLTALPTAV